MKTLWPLSILALLVACSGDEGAATGDRTTDTGAADQDSGAGTDDVAADTTAEDSGVGTDDVAADTTADSGSGADVVEDTAVEADTAEDAAADTAIEPDTTTDTTPDTSGSGDATATLLLTSPVMVDAGTMPARHTCDDLGVSPPLAWTGVPDGTGTFVMLATTLARDGKKWNWVLFNLPASQRDLAEGQTDVGTFGRTSDGPALAYAPPCSQGPGEKFCTFTLYALDAPLTFTGDPASVTGDVVEAALPGHVLAETAFTVGYTRPVP